MTKNATANAKAKLFMHGRSQAVRLPKNSVCQAKRSACAASGAGYCWSRSNSTLNHGSPTLDRFATSFMKGREQPPMPDDDESLD